MAKVSLPLCVPVKFEFDLEITNQLTFSLVYQALAGRNLSTQIHSWSKNVLGSIGPAVVAMKLSGLNSSFLVRGALQPPGGAVGSSAYMMNFEVNPAALGVQADMVMSHGCMGMSTDSGCSGIKIDASTLGQTTWQSIRDNMALGFGSSWQDSLLPDSLNTSSKAGPAFSFRLNDEGLYFGLEASGGLSLATAPSIDSLLPKASIALELEVSRSKAEFQLDANLTYLEIDTTIALDIDLGAPPPSARLPAVNKFNMRIDTRSLLNGIILAVEDASAIIYNVANTLGLFDQIWVNHLDLRFAGGIANMELSMRLFGTDRKFTQSANLNEVLDRVKALGEGGLEACKSFANQMLQTIEDKITDTDPCTCEDSCEGGEYADTYRTETYGCTMYGFKEVCGRSFIPCGCEPYWDWGPKCRDNNCCWDEPGNWYYPDGCTRQVHTGKVWNSGHRRRSCTWVGGFPHKSLHQCWEDGGPGGAEEVLGVDTGMPPVGKRWCDATESGGRRRR
jgi:hypothetical protein